MVLIDYNLINQFTNYELALSVVDISMKTIKKVDQD